ncbi:hypothetical protein AB0K00_10235 [Dactylosporangium sp. NPDC049525]|uniref:hypothetical protein n=1 Tax=Dactylosporangium sp. NPDC049525 TaxID=3154730 RepID=UPI0034154A94
MVKRTGRRVVTAMAVALALALAGCTNASNTSDAQQLYDRAAVSESDVRLDNAVMAFFVGPQNSEMYTVVGEVHRPGYLVLVNADGSFRTVKTKRMDMMSPIWSRHGLYFTDESDDYQLTATGLTKTANTKINAQNQMFALPEGGAVGVYNAGFVDGGGYNNQVSVTKAGTARLYNVQGNYFTGALCGSEIFGLTNRPGTHDREAAQLPNMTSSMDQSSRPQMLARLYPADGGEKVVAWRPHFGGGTPAGRVPCRENVITFLSWDRDSQGGEQPNVVSWDTRTGEYQAHPLTFDDGTRLNFEYFGGIVQDVQAGKLQWIYGDGRVFSTDSRTGQTTTEFDTNLGAGARVPSQTTFVFSGAQLHALSTVPGGEGEMVYTVLSRTDGKVLSRVSVHIPNTSVNVSYLNLSHMAVRPAL